MDNLTSKLLSITNKIGKLCFLNILYILFCIPVITIGASTAALYTCIFLIIDNEDGYLFQTFLSSFRQNFRQSTFLWGVLCLLYVFLGFDLYWTSFLPNQTRLIVSAVILILVLYLYFLSCHLFAFSARFHIKTRFLLRSCFILTAKYLFLTLILAMMNAAVFLPFILRPSFFLSFLPAVVFLGFSCTAYVNGRILNHIFIKESLIDNPKKETPHDRV